MIENKAISIKSKFRNIKMKTFLIQVLIAISITIKNNDCRPESSLYYDDYSDSNETDQSSGEVYVILILN